MNCQSRLRKKAQSQVKIDTKLQQLLACHLNAASTTDNTSAHFVGGKDHQYSPLFPCSIILSLFKFNQSSQEEIFLIILICKKGIFQQIKVHVV